MLFIRQNVPLGIYLYIEVQSCIPVVTTEQSMHFINQALILIKIR